MEKNVTNGSNKQEEFIAKKIIIILYSATSLWLFYTAWRVHAVIVGSTNSMHDASDTMSKIRSVSGDSIAESYYQQAGNVYSSFAEGLSGMRIFFIAILIFLGIICIIKALKESENLKVSIN
ncbi:hypothetical protein OZX60_03460 [Streptococcaceae bacterium ESL0687]|nr:hypothetical protein OZX60_03460 [Streptococcaceae bacterium ESL0687]